MRFNVNFMRRCALWPRRPLYSTLFLALSVLYCLLNRNGIQGLCPRAVACLTYQSDFTQAWAFHDRNYVQDMSHMIILMTRVRVLNRNEQQDDPQCLFQIFQNSPYTMNKQALSSYNNLSVCWSMAVWVTLLAFLIEYVHSVSELL